MVKRIFNKSKLSNGLTIITEKHLHTDAVVMGISVKVGSRDEKEHIGVTHFLEHQVFKGTKKFSSFDIVHELECVGGDVNAYTGREYTCFHSTCLSEDMPLALEILFDLVSNANLKEDDFTQERQVILQELAMSKDNPEEFLIDDFFEKYYANTCLGLPILGTEQSLKKMTAAAVQEHYQKYYNLDNMILSVAGDVEHDELVELAEKLSLGARENSESLESFTERDSVPSNQFIHFVDKEMEQALFMMAFPTTSITEGAFYEVPIINAYLGGGMNSRLFQELRENNPLVYNVSSSFSPFLQSGNYSIFAGTEPNCIEQALEITLNELRNLKGAGVPEEWIQWSQKQMRGNLLLTAPDLEGRMNSILFDELMGREYRSVEYIIDQIYNVTMESTQEYLDKHFKIAESSFYFMGKLDKNLKKKLNSICENF